MAAANLAEALSVAHLFVTGGPLLLAGESAERLTLLGRAWGLAFPKKEALNLGCKGCVAEGYTRLLHWYNQNYSPTAAGPDAQQQLTTPPIMATTPNGARRYTLRNPSTDYREFGEAEGINASTITDAKVAAAIKRNPAAAAYFYDTQEGVDAGTTTHSAAEAVGAAGNAPTPQVAAAQTKLLTMMARVLPTTTGELNAMIADLESQHPEATGPVQGGGSDATHTATDGMDAEEVAALAAKQAAEGQQALGNKVAAPATDATTTDTTAKPFDGNDPDTGKLPTPSKVRNMNTAELIAQYTHEVGEAPNREELPTNGALANAIIAYREKLAE